MILTKSYRVSKRTSTSSHNTISKRLNGSNSRIFSAAYDYVHSRAPTHTSTLENKGQKDREGLVYNSSKFLSFVQVAYETPAHNNMFSRLKKLTQLCGQFMLFYLLLIMRS